MFHHSARCPALSLLWGSRDLRTDVMLAHCAAERPCEGASPGFLFTERSGHQHKTEDKHVAQLTARRRLATTYDDRRVLSRQIHDARP